MDFTKTKFTRYFLSLSTLLSSNVFGSECTKLVKDFATDSKKNEYECVLSYTKNTRDLGGYIATDNKVTKGNKIFRSDIISNESDIDKLCKLGLSLVIDLRSSYETKKCIDPLSNIPNVKYLNVPLIFDNDDLKKIENNKILWHEFYIKTVKSSKDQIKKIFESIAEAKGLTVVHCSFGKDRTGIISALILGLCGVKKEDIINNYAVTQELLNDDISKIPNLFSTDRGIMIKFLKFMDDQGGIENFLLNDCGIKQDTLDGVKSQILDIK